MNSFTEFIKNNKWRIILVSAGIVLTILMFVIGFWRTLLLAVIVGVCYLFGLLLDQGGRERVKQFFDHLFRKN